MRASTNQRQLVLEKFSMCSGGFYVDKGTNACVKCVKGVATTFRAFIIRAVIAQGYSVSNIMAEQTTLD